MLMGVKRLKYPEAGITSFYFLYWNGSNAYNSFSYSHYHHKNQIYNLLSTNRLLKKTYTPLIGQLLNFVIFVGLFQPFWGIG
jgi:hypothetical protein